jgi:enoyl-CoA hydratase/carnithine racemase
MTPMPQSDVRSSSALSDPDAELLHTRDDRGVHTLTLNRPSGFNVLSDGMLDALVVALAHVAQDVDARAVVLAAAGKAFCAGHNLKEMSAYPDQAAHQALFNKCTKVMLGIQNLGVPVIARVQGLATAAGCQLVAQCDLAVAVESAKFGVNGISIGLFCSTPSVPLSRNIPQKRAMEMLVTGQFISAQQALADGLINRAVPAEQLDDAVEALVQAILTKPAEALAMGKQLFYQQRETGMAAAYQLAGHTMACNMMLPCTQEGVQAFTEKRTPSWAVPGAR